jgi:hypothetical protein
MLYRINPAFLPQELQSLKMNEVAVKILMGPREALFLLR